jgi:hypothetical protein
MPPSGPLAKDVIANFATWIAQGAGDPRDTPPSDQEVVGEGARATPGVVELSGAYSSGPTSPERCRLDGQSTSGQRCCIFQVWITSGGRDFRLTDLHGNVIRPIIAQ